MTALVALPVLLPLGLALVGVLLPRSARARQVLAFVGTSSLLVAGGVLLATVWRRGVLVVQVGGWDAPLGISLVADLTSSLMVVVSGVIGWTSVLFSLRTIAPRRQAGAYYPLVLVLLAAVCGAFLTGDLFNLFVWLEILLISSFALAALPGSRANLEGATKYLVLSLVGSALLLLGIALLYGQAGSLNLADLHRRLQAAPAGPTMVAPVVLLVALSLKSAAFPLFFWLPASYHVAPPAVISLFSALLTKVGAYALLRLSTLVFVQDPEVTRTALVAIGVATMVTGVLGAVAQYDIRRLLSFHIISQMGYLIAGIGLGGSLALAATLTFFVHVIFAKSALFLVAGIAGRACRTFDLRRMGGLYRDAPGVSLLFLVPAMSLAGIPPLSGFVAKLSLVRAAVQQEAWLVVAAALGVGLLTLFSMIKIWREAFWKDPPQRRGAMPRPGRQPPSMVIACAVLAVLSIALGVAAEPLLQITQAAAQQLSSPDWYVGAVLQGE